MIPKVYFDKSEVEHLAALVSRFGPLDLASPFRSSVPMVALVREALPAIETILAACDFHGDPAMHFEFRVAPPKGPPGEALRPSQTDVMVIGSAEAAAIEAKWTEPRYQSVAKRLERMPKEVGESRAEVQQVWRHGQRLLLEGWLELLKPHTAKPLQVEGIGDVVYQMLHRAASASAVSPCPRLVYLHFEANGWHEGATEGQYHKDLLALWTLLGSPETFPFYLVTVPMAFLPAFETIRHLKKGAAATDKAVRTALVEKHLFQFGEPRIERIVGES